MISGQNFNPAVITEFFKTQKMCFFVIFNCKPRKIQKVEILFLIIGQWSIYHKIRPRRMKSKTFSPYLLPLNKRINFRPVFGKVQGERQMVKLPCLCVIGWVGPRGDMFHGLSTLPPLEILRP